MFYMQNQQKLPHFHEFFAEVLVAFCLQHFWNESRYVSALLFLPLNISPPLARHISLSFHSWVQTCKDSSQ